HDHVAGLRIDFDDIVIVSVAAIVGRGIRSFRALARIKQTPVLPVNVEMNVTAALALVAHQQLRIARELIAQENSLRVALEAPGIVLEGAQVEGIELARSVLAKDFEAQFARAVILAEVEPEGVLGIIRAAAESAPQ